MPEKKCTGDCIKCSLQQQIYCSAQYSHEILAKQHSLEDRLNSLAARLDSLTTAPANIINPLGTQEGSGVENREPQLLQ